VVTKCALHPNPQAPPRRPSVLSAPQPYYDGRSESSFATTEKAENVMDRLSVPPLRRWLSNLLTRISPSCQQQFRKIHRADKILPPDRFLPHRICKSRRATSHPIVGYPPVEVRSETVTVKNKQSVIFSVQTTRLSINNIIVSPCSPPPTPCHLTA